MYAWKITLPRGAMPWRRICTGRTGRHETLWLAYGAALKLFSSANKHSAASACHQSAHLCECVALGCAVSQTNARKISDMTACTGARASAL